MQSILTTRNSPVAQSVVPLFAALFLTTAAAAQTPEKKAVEQSLLAAARQNIERYRKGDAILTFTDSAGKPLKGLKVAVNQTTQDFLFGNLSEELLRPSLTAEEKQKFTERFTGLFNFTELTVKWTPYERQQGKPDWQSLQQKLDWCKANGVTPKGHTLAWTNMSGTPRWVLKLPYDQTVDLHRARIQNLVGGFASQIKMWDVVNEPVTTVAWKAAMADSVFGESKIDEGSRYNVKSQTRNDVLPWVEDCLRWAYAADPSAELMLNEFYIIAKPQIRQKFYDLIKALQDRKVPLSGVGIQAHEPREMWFSPQEIVTTFNKFDSLGLPLHITEFIPQSSGKSITGGWRTGLWTEEAQAEFAEQFYTLAFGHPSMASIHWWGLTDKMIWLKGGGLLDEQMNPKPVYTGLQKLIKGDWMTRGLSLTTDKKGSTGFRGFFGAYEVVLTKPDGSTQKFAVRVGSKNKNSFRLVVK